MESGSRMCVLVSTPLVWATLNATRLKENCDVANVGIVSTPLVWATLNATWIGILCTVSRHMCFNALSVGNAQCNPALAYSVSRRAKVSTPLVWATLNATMQTEDIHKCQKCFNALSVGNAQCNIASHIYFHQYVCKLFQRP